MIVRQTLVPTVLLFIITVLSVAMVATWIWTRAQLEDQPSGVTTVNKQVNTSSPTNTRTSNTNSTAVAANTNGSAATWSIYSNNTVGYTVQYPSDWSLTEGNPVMFYDPRAQTQALETELLLGSKIEIVSEESSAATIDDAIAELNAEGRLSEKDITVDGAVAKKITQTDVFGAYNNVVYLLRNSKLLTIVQYIPEIALQSSYTTIFNEILSTFQFTE